MSSQEGAAKPVPAVLSGMEEDLKKGLLPLRVFNNREIYELELRRIFARSWVYIGHETELPNRGDYALRYIGEDPFIFVRDSEGAIRVLFNSCRHRGVQVCRSEMGNTSHFNCPYHGWSYRNSGKLDAVPARSQGYRELDLKDWGLHAAPHVANYCGLIFATLDPDAVPFEEHLGRYRWYLDIQFMLSAGGMEVLGEPHRWQVDANWKQGAENFCGDSSHTQMTHRSVLATGMVPNAVAGAPGKAHGLHVHDCDGHAISTRLVAPGGTAFWDYPEDVTRHFSAGRLDQAQFDLARRGLVHDGTVFPNFSFLHISVTDSAERPPAGYLCIRVWQPRGPGRTEIWNWILAPKEASESYKRRAYQLGMSSFSPSGSFEQDDVAVWPGIARSARTVFAEMNDLKLNYQMGLGGMADYQPIAGWAGPGVAVPSNAGEGGLRTFHDTWYRHMLGAGMRRRD
jgi:phenylpropionate dioxygenase-like ring-hydroxylating dioxygenase large terminal subunit